MWSQNNSSPVFSAICLLQNKNKQIIFYRHLHLENEWLHLVRVRYLMNRTVQMTFLPPSYRHVVYERTRRSPLDYSLSSKHRCEASVSMRHSITNELFHRAIFRYIFTKKRIVSMMMRVGDHVAHERVNLIVFDYLVNSEERPQTCRQWLKWTSRQTVVFMLLHIFEYLTVRCEM